MRCPDLGSFPMVQMDLVPKKTTIQTSLVYSSIILKDRCAECETGTLVEGVQVCVADVAHLVIVLIFSGPKKTHIQTSHTCSIVSKDRCAEFDTWLILMVQPQVGLCYNMRPVGANMERHEMSSQMHLLGVTPNIHLFHSFSLNEP